MRETWTDARLDDFAKHVDIRFDAVDKRLDAVDKRLVAIDKRFDALQRTLLLASGGVTVALIGLIATQL
jgi:hypothetical protein